MPSCIVVYFFSSAIIFFMLKIKEENLKDLLFRRKKHIKTHFPVFETISCILSFVVTILLSDFENASFGVKVLVVLACIAYVVACIISFYGSNYSVDAFYKDICSVAEKEHNFSLLLLRDTSETFPVSYLLRKDTRWKCWLFPYIRTNAENDKQSVIDYVKSVFKIKNVDIKKITEQDFTKYSVSANLQKTYHHTFYLIEFNALLSPACKKKFSAGGNKYKWFTISQMKENKHIIERNDENVRYIEKNFGY